MAVLRRDQVIGYASKAGFKGNALAIIVAIAQAESGFDASITSKPNWDGSVDRGLYQINSRAHNEVSDTCAYDPACSSAAVWRISSGGTNFNPWSTYQNGAYKKYLGSMPTTGDTSSGLAKVDISWLNYGYYQPNAYKTTAIPGVPDTPHFAYDYQTPFHSNLTSLVNGVVVKAGYQAWGGEVFIKPDAGPMVPVVNGLNLYYYHLDQITVKAGQRVSIGQSIGLSGGQNSGGSHPVSTQWSTGPHTHVGWFTQWLNGKPFGPDLGLYIKWLKSQNAAGGVPVGAGSTSTGSINSLGIPTFDSVLTQVHETLTSHEGFYAIALALDEVEQIPGFVNLSTSEWDVVGHIRSIGATIGDNFVPISIRTTIFSLGLLIVVLVITKHVLDAGQQALPLIESLL